MKPLIILTLVALAVFFGGCANQSDPYVSGDYLQTAEANGSFVAEQRWELQPLSTGVWYSLNATDDDSPPSQFVNVVDTQGHFLFVRCAGGRVKLSHSSDGRGELLKGAKGSKPEYILRVPEAGR